MRLELEKALNKPQLLPKTTGTDGRALRDSWDAYRRKLRELVGRGGEIRVRNHVFEPLIERLGYERLEAAGEVETREGMESGGHQLLGPNGGALRVWATAFEEDLDAPARAFSFASTSLWRNTFSPSVALAPHVRSVLDDSAETGRFLEDGVQTLFRLFTDGIHCTELHIAPLGGALFGEKSTPLFSRLQWGERAVASLLDRLLWTPKRRGAEGRERVHYGPLDVEDLGRVYEALLELEPGIATVRMCRLRRQKLEVVVPFAQGERYLPRQLG